MFVEPDWDTDKQIEAMLATSSEKNKAKKKKKKIKKTSKQENAKNIPGKESVDNIDKLEKNDDEAKTELADHKNQSIKKKKTIASDELVKKVVDESKSLPVKSISNNQGNQSLKKKNKKKSKQKCCNKYKELNLLQKKLRGEFVENENPEERMEVDEREDDQKSVTVGDGLIVQPSVKKLKKKHKLKKDKSEQLSNDKSIQDEDHSNTSGVNNNKQKKRKATEEVLKIVSDEQNSENKVPNRKRKLNEENDTKMETENFVKTSKKRKLSTSSDMVVRSSDVESSKLVDSSNSSSKPSPEKSSAKSKFDKNKLKQILGKQSQNKETEEEKSKEELDDNSLATKMKKKLESSRFRFINESLYTTTGEQAVEMFSEDKDLFKVYHEGFTNQVAKWPVNPVNLMIDYISKRPSELVVADFGCGDAKIAQGVKNETVHSFDLVALNKFVTVCDISKVPLPSNSVDIAVFCLSLMGTNFLSYLCEASRVLKMNGVLLVAEVLSRFEKVGQFIRKMRKMGFSVEKKDDSNKMFIWFAFKKVGRLPNKEKLPQIELLPCIYKKR